MNGRWLPELLFTGALLMIKKMIDAVKNIYTKTQFFLEKNRLIYAINVDYFVQIFALILNVYEVNWLFLILSLLFQD